MINNNTFYNYYPQKPCDHIYHYIICTWVPAAYRVFAFCSPQKARNPTGGRVVRVNTILWPQILHLRYVAGENPNPQARTYNIHLFPYHVYNGGGVD